MRACVCDEASQSPSYVVIREAYNLVHDRSDVSKKVAIRADVERQLAEQVRDAAAADGRSIAGWVRFQLTKALADDYKEDRQ